MTAGTSLPPLLSLAFADTVGPLIVLTWMATVAFALVMLVIQPKRGLLWAVMGLVGALLCAGLVMTFIVVVDPPPGSTRWAFAPYLAAGTMGAVLLLIGERNKFRALRRMPTPTGRGAGTRAPTIRERSERSSK